jgi:hypothetical protein
MHTCICICSTSIGVIGHMTIIRTRASAIAPRAHDDAILIVGILQLFKRRFVHLDKQRQAALNPIRAFAQARATSRLPQRVHWAARNISSSSSHNSNSVCVCVCVCVCIYAYCLYV